MIQQHARLIELSYLAGIFDGEGSISISGYRPSHLRNGQGTHGKYYQLTAQIGMQNEKPLKRFAKMFPGSYPVKQDTIFRIAWSTRKAGVVLEGLLPYLDVKRPQAELGIAFQSLRKHGRSIHYTAEEQERDAMMPCFIS